MNLLSCYESQICWAREGRIQSLAQVEQKQQQIRKLIQTLKQKFRSQSITIISPQICSRNPIKMPIQSIEFSLINDSKLPQYDYCFQVEVKMNRNSLKITATILRQGRMLNIYKQGLTQTLGHYFQFANGFINYSLRIDPFTGVIKVVHLVHLTRNQIQDMYKFPVNFHQQIKGVIEDMISKLDGKLLGKILHAINQIPLKNILPQNFDCVVSDSCQPKVIKKIESSHPLFDVQTLHYFWILNKRLKQIRRYIANSSIKYPFFSNDSVAEKIRFSKQLIPGKKKQLQKQQKIARHNVKILPFSKQVKDILSYYTPINRLIQQQYSYKSGGDSFWLEPTPEQIKNIYTCLDCQNMKKNGRTYIPMTIQNIQNQQFICAGGFAQISHVVVTKVVKNINTSQIIKNKQSLIKKKAGKQKLFWEKKVIQHIGAHSCLFINKYFKLQIDAESSNLTKKMFDDSLFMEFCHQKSLNNYIAKMKPVLSVKSRVFWLYQVSIGLRFLRDLGVVHLDVKPQNLLMKIQPNGTVNGFQIIKLIDFGQAYAQTLLQNQKRNRGHTCPYASPQLVKHTQSKYTQKSDVFSLGVMILIIIFQLNTVDIKRLTSNVIYDSNVWYIKLYSICVQKCRYLGYQPLMQALLNLAYKCINPVVSSRPYLNWISVILKNILFGFQELDKIRL